MIAERNSECSRRKNRQSMQHQAQMFNRAIEAESEEAHRPGENQRLFVVMAVVVMIKPVGEYCMELYTDLMMQWHALTAFVDF